MNKKEVEIQPLDDRLNKFLKDMAEREGMTPEDLAGRIVEGVLARKTAPPVTGGTVRCFRRKTD